MTMDCRRKDIVIIFLFNSINLIVVVSLMITDVSKFVEIAIIRMYWMGRF